MTYGLGVMLYIVHMKSYRGGCDVIQKWVRCQWRRFDDIDIVGAMSNTGAVVSCLKWM